MDQCRMMIVLLCVVGASLSSMERLKNGSYLQSSIIRSQVYTRQRIAVVLHATASGGSVPHGYLPSRCWSCAQHVDKNLSVGSRGFGYGEKVKASNKPRILLHPSNLSLWSTGLSSRTTLRERAVLLK